VGKFIFVYVLIVLKSSSELIMESHLVTSEHVLRIILFRECNIFALTDRSAQESLPTQLVPINRANPYLRTPEPTQGVISKPRLIK
jgi:hypothetical protein